MDIQDWLGKDNQLGIDIWQKKYRYNNESFDEWLDRVSGNNPKIRNLILQKKMLFGGRTLSNRGINRGSLANCYSRGFIEDSLDDIMQACTDLAKTYKSQGGQGLSLSKIRPKGTLIGNQYKSDGIVPFMEMFNTVTNSISQGGSRKGALLMSCDVWHKDIEDFITIKAKEGKIEKANLSVEIDNEFMECVKNNITSKQVTRTYGNNTITYEVNPVKIYNLICEYARNYAEPGIIFTNTFRNYNIMEFVDSYQIETCNPCGEQPLIKNGCCNLLSINLSEYVNNPFTERASFKEDEFINDIGIILEESDKIIDENISNHALSSQQEAARTWRNCGMGIMGLAECLAKLNIVYGSKDSCEFIRRVMHTYFRTAVYASVKLAEKKGNFPGYTPKVWDSTIMKNAFTSKELDKLKHNNKLRNCSLLSVAPTGTLATMLNISGGIEPWFATSYKRRTVSLNGQETIYDVDVKALQEYKELYPDTDNFDVFVTASDINYLDRINIQSACQYFVDTSISSTINLPKETTVEDIKSLYMYAWSAGLKGITIYVEGSRNPILSNTGFKNNTEINKFPITTAPKRPKTLEGDFYKIKANGEWFGIFIGLYNNKPYEVFALPVPTKAIGEWPTISKGTITKIKKKVYKYTSEDGFIIDNIALNPEEYKEWRNTTLHVSAMLRHGMPIESIMKIEDKCNDIITSFNKAIWKVLAKYAKDGATGDKCPECGAEVIRESGCVHCTNCGWSRCMFMLTNSKFYINNYED